MSASLLRRGHAFNFIDFFSPVHPHASGLPGAQNVQCERDMHCDRFAGGVCHVAPSGNQWCAYPDPACPSGYRYSDLDVGDGISGQCTEIDGSSDWSRQFGGVGDDRGTSIALAPNGDVVVAGWFLDTVTLGGNPLSSAGQEDGWVARYRSDGTPLWSTRFGGAGRDTATAIAVDNAGDVYVVGTFQGPVNFGGAVRTNSRGGFLVKLNGTSGAYQWDKTYGSTGIDIAIDVAIIDDSTVILSGIFTGTVDFGGGARTATPLEGTDCILAAYDLSGVHSWSKPLTTAGNDYDGCFIASSNSDLIVTGAFLETAMLGGTPLSSTGATDLFIAKFRGIDGAHLWSTRQGGANFEYPSAIATDGSRVFVGGRFQQTTNLGGTPLTSVDSPDAFMAAYQVADGAHVWSQRFGDRGLNAIEAIAATQTKLIATVAFTGGLSLEQQSFTTSPIGVGDVAILRLDPANGTLQLSSQFGSPGYDQLNITHSTDRLFGIGTFAETLPLFGGTVRSDGGDDIVIFRIDF